jgi:glycosyltransferase involved in cell wall biosynthesis
VLLLKKNIGSCKAFNRGLTLAKGDFIIDFATDDMLLPTRIETGVRELDEAGPQAGVHFSDAQYIDENNNPLYVHSDKHPHASIPQGNIYKDIIQRYFICPPTLMMRKTVIDFLGGFDERLLYEDFDFLVRSSRNVDYCYSRQVLVNRRIVKGALSSKQFTFFSRHARSTYHVCLKILDLNKNKQEQQALNKRIYYELKVNIRYLNLRLVLKYLWLLFRNARRTFL